MMTVQFCMILRPQDEAAFILTQYYWNLFYHHHYVPLSFFLPPSSSPLFLPLPLTHTYTQMLYKNTQAGIYIPVQSIQYQIKSYFKIVSSA